MRLVEIAVESFRNLADTRQVLAPATTVLLGDNGQGKTSFLEAIGVLATTKSFRRAKAAEMARHGSVRFRVAGRVESDFGTPLDLDVECVDGSRVTRTGRTAIDLAEYIGHLVVVPITQAHAGIIRGAPQERRDFLDRGLMGVRPAYLRTLARYRQTLRQKSALLRAGAASRETELATWNDRLAREGADVTLERRAYFGELASALAALSPTFLPDAEPLAMSLRDAVSREGNDGMPADRTVVADRLREQLDAATRREIAQRLAVVGPHRDELVLSLAGRDIRKFASSGQQRNALLALKLAKVEVFRQRRGETPVLLIDDVDTEIDRTRLLRFLAHVGGRAQAVLTSSKKDLFDRPPEDALFLAVRGGLLTPT